MDRSTVYPFLHFQPGVDWKDVNAGLLQKLNRLGMRTNTVVTVTSGYRSVAEQQYLWDNAKQLGLVRGVTVARPGSSDHNFGRAVDATVGGKPIGQVFTQGQFAKVGLKYLPRDTVHVTFLSSKEGGSSAAPQPAADTPSAAPAAASADPGAPPTVTAPAAVPPPTALGTPTGGVDLPGSVNYFDTHQQTASLWQQVAANKTQVSPETQLLLSNAQLSAGV